MAHNVYLCPRQWLSLNVAKRAGEQPHVGSRLASMYRQYAVVHLIVEPQRFEHLVEDGGHGRVVFVDADLGRMLHFAIRGKELQATLLVDFQEKLTDVHRLQVDGDFLVP